VSEFRTGARARRHQRVERHHAAGLTSYEEQTQLAGIPPEFRLGLDVYLVDAAELVEVVDVRAAQERAERRVDVAELHAGLQDLAAVDVGEDLRDAGAIEGVDPADLRTLACGFDELLRLLRQV